LIEAKQPDGLQSLDLTDARALLSKAANLRRFKAGETLVQNFAPGAWLYLLLEGGITFWSSGRADRELVTTDAAWTPFGWSALRSPSRYFSHVTSESEGQYLALSIEDIQKLSARQPLAAIALVAWCFGRAMPLTEMTRLTPEQQPAAPDLSQLVQAPQSEAEIPAIADVLERSPVLGGLGRETLETLARSGTTIQLAAGDYLSRQGQTSPGLAIMIWGQFNLYYRPSDAPDKLRERSATRPGSVVAWGGLQGQTINAIYDAQASRDSLVLLLEPRHCSQLVASHPYLVETLYHKQFWLLGRSLRSARALKQVDTSRSGIEILRALIDDNRLNLPPSSTLFAIEIMLNHTATRQVAFELLNRLPDSGSELERGIAAVALDTLRNLELETSLASALALCCPDPSRTKSPGLARRIRHARAMEEALNYSGFQISGLERLPDSANCIFIYNSLPGGEISHLANGQQLDLCAEFISAKIAYPHYGRPVAWITNPSASSASATILGAIAPPQSHLSDADAFLDETQAALDSGCPLLIAPEGEDDGDWRDQSTATSPGPLRPGALVLAQSLKSKPLIVPVALANFEGDPADVVLSAAIQEPLPPESLPDSNDRAAVKTFLAALRQRFKTWVAEARDQALAPAPDLASDKGAPQVWTNRRSVGALEREFQADVLQAEQSFHANREPQGEIMLYGSSSLRFWQTAEADLGLSPLFNLAFGGSTLPACHHYFDRLVTPLAPRGMIFYCGDNDLSRHGDPERVLHHFQRYADRQAERLPYCRSLLVSIKPSPLRFSLLDQVLEANAALEQELAERPSWRYVSVVEAMLDEQGRPKPELYAEDRLHLSPAGYALWAEALRPHLSWLSGGPKG
jgi:lysophospholipase L1-like esterase/CRP-like cAMP-binding protein